MMTKENAKKEAFKRQKNLMNNIMKYFGSYNQAQITLGINRSMLYAWHNELNMMTLDHMIMLESFIKSK